VWSQNVKHFAPVLWPTQEFETNKDFQKPHLIIYELNKREKQYFLSS